MKTISIPKPCHENWSEMTPSEKGRFCKACAKVVVDFTTMNSVGILDHLKQSQGQEVCGRIKNSQLEQVNLDFNPNIFQSKQSFQSAFVFSLMLTFGLTLFSCNSQEQNGEFELFRKETIDKILEEVNKIQNESMLTVGEMAIDLDKIETIIYEENVVLGGISEIHEFRNIDKEMDEVIVSGELPLIDHMIMGGMSFYPVILEEITPVKNIAVEYDEKGNLLPNEFSLSAYPNPTINYAKIEVKVPNNEIFDWYLISSEGKLIQSNHQLELKRGTHTIDLDLMNQTPGIYFFNVQSASFKESIRILKN